MPQATLSAARLLEGLDPSPPPEELRSALDLSKVEVERWTGDVLTVSCTPDRLDLLCETGLRAYLDGATGRSLGLPTLRDHSLPPGEFLEATARVAPLRAEVAALLLHAPPGVALDEGLLAEAVRFQELLHATLGRERRLASLGMYPGGSLRFPLRYDREPMSGTEFVPLGETQAVPVARFFAEHPMAAKYGAVGREGEDCLTLRDGSGAILSLPPVLNGAAVGEIRAGDRRILLESTGTSRPRVSESLVLLAMPFLLRGWSAGPVRVKAHDGVRAGDELLAPRHLELSAELLTRSGGLQIDPLEVEQLLGRARYAHRRAGEDWLVAAPPWRNDLMAPVDVVEDLLLLRGFRSEEGRFPPSATAGHRRPRIRWRQRTSTLLLGLGFVPVVNPVLGSEELVAALGRSGALELENPVSRELSRARDTLSLSLLASLQRNRRSGYPQRLSELGPVLLRDPEAESGARTEQHLGFVIAGERAGLSDAAAVLDYLLRRSDVTGVREPAQLPGSIAGRAARLRLAGVALAEMGEIHPEVLETLGIPVPVAWGELDLDALYPLLESPTEGAPGTAATPRHTAPGPADSGTGVKTEI
jgi:phenylalanyl-tRNA synthetase beta chain